ncbi:hypothetical protein BaRGS_00025096 [Batillaria attramentaria]|uniref:Uncharacterized protein n=1 Tax=Batillaria attramentaria TaxID=370345 RepID=A0ABD0K9B6_9CAEN
MRGHVNRIDRVSSQGREFGTRDTTIPEELYSHRVTAGNPPILQTLTESNIHPSAPIDWVGKNLQNEFVLFSSQNRTSSVNSLSSEQLGGLQLLAS